MDATFKGQPCSGDLQTNQAFYFQQAALSAS